MKQHITIAQWDELNNEQKYKIVEWSNKRSPDEFEVDKFGITKSPLSIGQMIEFLFDNDFGPIITSNDNAFYWIVEPDKKLDCWKKFSYENAELCDALWEAVKDVLEMR